MTPDPDIEAATEFTGDAIFAYLAAAFAALAFGVPLLLAGFGR